MNEDRIVLKHALLFPMYYDKTGSVKEYETIIPKELVKEVLQRLRGGFRKRPGIAKAKNVYIQKFYYHNSAHLIRKWELSSEQCVTEPKTDIRRTHPPQQNPSESVRVPEDARQSDLILELSSTSGYKHIFKAMKVFPRYLFADPTLNQVAKLTVKGKTNIHQY